MHIYIINPTHSLHQPIYTDTHPTYITPISLHRPTPIYNFPSLINPLAPLIIIYTTIKYIFIYGIFK